MYNIKTQIGKCARILLPNLMKWFVENNNNTS